MLGSRTSQVRSSGMPCPGENPCLAGGKKNLALTWRKISSSTVGEKQSPVVSNSCFNDSLPCLSFQEMRC